MGPLEVAERLFSAVFLYFRLLVLRTALFIRQTIIYRTAPIPKHSHTALLIGDATALGLGDSLANLGLSSRLTTLLRDASTEPSPRHFWRVATLGKLNSRAADWSPGSAARLFERALVSGPFRSAELVVVVLGAHDDIAGEGGEIVSHVARIAEGLVRLGKHAVVVTLPNPHPVNSEMHARVREANRGLKEALEQIREENDGPRSGSLAWDADIGKVFALGNEMLRFENNFVALNGNGFRMLARELYEPFVMAAKRVEWAQIKAQLTG